MSMTTILRRTAALAGAAVFLSAAVPAAACDLSVGWEPWEPFQYAGSDGTPTGVDIDLVSAFADEAGCTVTFVEMPWARQLKEVEAGGLDVAMSATQTAERKAYAHFTAPYREEEFRLFVRTGEAANYPETSVRDAILAMGKVGIVRGYYAGDAVEAMKSDPATAGHFDEGAEEALNFKKLAAGRVDGAIADRFVGFAIIKAQNLGGQVQLHPVAVQADGVSLMLSNASVPDEVRRKLDAAIESVKASGRYDAILARYL